MSDGRYRLCVVRSLASGGDTGVRVIDMLRDMGWTVVEVPGLMVAVALVRALDLILVRSGVTDEEVARATEDLLLDAGQAPHG